HLVAQRLLLREHASRRRPNRSVIQIRAGGVQEPVIEHGAAEGGHRLILRGAWPTPSGHCRIGVSVKSLLSLSGFAAIRPSVRRPALAILRRALDAAGSRRESRHPWAAIPSSLRVSSTESMPLERTPQLVGKRSQ